MKKVKVPKGTYLFVVGDVHEHEDHFRRAIQTVKPGPTRWFASVGDIYHKGYGTDAAARITDQLKNLSERGVGFAVKGNHEIKEIKKIKKSKGVLSSQLAWFDRQPLAIEFTFESTGNKVLLVHGGVTPLMTYKDLEDQLDIVYVRYVDNEGKHVPFKRVKKDGYTFFEMVREGVIWHEKYDGRFGYVVSGHSSQMDGKPKFYNYSANLDTGCFETGVLTVLEFTDQGKKGRTIQVEGEAKHSRSNGEKENN